ncbi:MAG: hypothetical protein RRY54_04350 [Angelakisella sp.]
MKVFKRGITSSAPMQYLPMKTDFAYEVGKALSIAGGVADTATAAPEYVCVSKAKGVSGGFVQSVHVLEDMIFAATLTADGAALKIGDKVTIAADGINLTATTASGVAEITGFDGKAIGSTVYFKF